MSASLIPYEIHNSYESALEAAAKLWGIDLSYFDIFGKKHQAKPEVVRAILESLGVDAGSVESLNEAIKAHHAEEWANALPPVEVVGRHAHTPAWVNLPAAYDVSPILVTFTWEDGSTATYTHAAGALEVLGRAQVGRTVYTRRRIPLPNETSLGYHRMCVEVGLPGHTTLRAETDLIVTPDRAYAPPELAGDGKLAGLGVSLYGLRSQRNWGCGDFTDLKALCRWAVKALDCSFVALNPLHIIANRLPFNASPYLPISAFFKNFLYIDIERIPEFRNSPLAQKAWADGKLRARIERMRLDELVDYEGIAQIKTGFLAWCFLAFRKEWRRGSARGRAFDSWLAGQGEVLEGYTTFCALDRVMHRRNPNVWIWQDWPEEYRDPESPAVKAFAARRKHLRMFYAWVQWIAFHQLDEAGEAAESCGMAIGLYHDLALATDNCGADVWRQRRFYVTGCRVGAPPDDFSPEGQDWSFPPPNFLEHRRNGYKLFRETLRRNMVAGGALRIDHVMRFFRLYWIPAGFKANEGTYVRDFAEDLVRILALESIRHQVLIVGEDLGTVEPATRKMLSRFGVLSYRLFYFERGQEGEMILPEQYPVDALVATSTHDLPTLAGSWIGRDIEARDYAGLLPVHEEYERQWAERRKLRQAILDALFAEGLMPSYYSRWASDIPELTGELHNAVVGYLARTPAKLFQLNQEDLTKALDQQNLPGSTWQYPNWRRKMSCFLEDLDADPVVAGSAAMFRHWLKETGRQNR
jgi:4-alpha-glucanotransferase